MIFFPIYFSSQFVYINFASCLWCTKLNIGVLAFACVQFSRAVCLSSVCIILCTCRLVELCCTRILYVPILYHIVQRRRRRRRRRWWHSINGAQHLVHLNLFGALVVDTCIREAFTIFHTSYTPRMTNPISIQTMNAPVIRSRRVWRFIWIRFSAAVTQCALRRIVRFRIRQFP